jgi:hypothetical protein
MNTIDISQPVTDDINVIVLEASRANYKITSWDLSAVGTTAQATIRVNGSLAKTVDLGSGASVTKNLDITVPIGKTAEFRLVSIVEEPPPGGFELTQAIALEYSEFRATPSELENDFNFSNVPTGKIPETEPGITPLAGIYIT